MSERVTLSRLDAYCRRPYHLLAGPDEEMQDHYEDDQVSSGSSGGPPMSALVRQLEREYPAILNKTTAVLQYPVDVATLKTIRACLLRLAEVERDRDDLKAHVNILIDGSTEHEMRAAWEQEKRGAAEVALAQAIERIEQIIVNPAWPRDALRGLLNDLRSHPPVEKVQRLVEALADLVPLARGAMEQANRDGGEFEITAELAEACAALQEWGKG